MICKHCGKETAYVICENCGVNVVWYNKYGIHKEEQSCVDYQVLDTNYSGIETYLTTIFNPNEHQDEGENYND